MTEFLYINGKPKEAAKRFVPYKLEFKCAANSPIEGNLYNRFIDKSDKKGVNKRETKGLPTMTYKYLIIQGIITDFC